MKGFQLSKISIAVIISLVIIAAVPVYIVISATVQSASITCKRCHPDVYATWKSSKEHPVSVSCRQCHAGHPETQTLPPGFLADDTQVTYHCLDCHQEIIEKREVERKLIKVSHRRHYDEGIGCLVCHRNIAHEGPVLQNNRPSKRACYRCHIREIDGSEKDKSCSMCHHIILSTPPAQS